MTDHLPSLIRAVEDADSSSLLLEAVENLASARLPGAIPTLIAALSYNNPGAAVAAVYSSSSISITILLEPGQSEPWLELVTLGDW
jgi:hypothetical protein